jgi:hypothetical protein
MNIPEIKTIECAEQTFVFEPKLLISQGRCGGNFSGAPKEKPKKIEFSVPLSCSIMSVDQWLTHENLEAPFLGVDRSVDPWRLAGVIYPVSKRPEAALAEGWNFMNREGASPDLFYRNENTFYFLTKDTWAWITQKGERKALVCLEPWSNGKFTVGT